MERRTLITLGGLGSAVLLTALFFGRSPKAAASYRVPADPSEVIETLPGGATSGGDARRRQVADLRRTLAHDPNNLRVALRLAHVDIQLARERSDPRYLGHAQAALAPWWNEQAPVDVLVLRATIEQSLHDFDSALLHLDQAIVLAPNNAQAWLTRAVVLTVLGRHDEARASCAKLEPLAASRLTITVCETQIDSLTGKAREAVARLAPVITPDLPPSEQAWAVSSLGEYALRLGDYGIAEAHFQHVLLLDAEDAYVRAALADLYIDLRRYDDAIALTQGREANDALLLRLAIAEKRARRPAAEPHIAMLSARFEASAARGDVVHRREESRFWLDLRGDAEKALALAKANWDVQKEPWDVRVFVEAARAAKQSGKGTFPHDAEPVLRFLATTKLEDPAIAKTVAELAQ